MCPGFQQRGNLKSSCPAWGWRELGWVVGIASCPCCFVPVLGSAQLHASLSPSDSISDRPGSLIASVFLCVCARVATQLVLLHSGREAYRSAPGLDGGEKCWQEQMQPRDQPMGPGWHRCHWLLGTQCSDSSLQRTEYRLLASGVSPTC